MTTQPTKDKCTCGFISPPTYGETRGHRFDCPLGNIEYGTGKQPERPVDYDKPLSPDDHSSYNGEVGERTRIGYVDPESKSDLQRFKEAAMRPDNKVIVHDPESNQAETDRPINPDCHLCHGNNGYINVLGNWTSCIACDKLTATLPPATELVDKCGNCGIPLNSRGFCPKGCNETRDIPEPPKARSAVGYAVQSLPSDNQREQIIDLIADHDLYTAYSDPNQTNGFIDDIEKLTKQEVDKARDDFADRLLAELSQVLDQPALGDVALAVDLLLTQENPNGR